MNWTQQDVDAYKAKFNGKAGKSADRQSEREFQREVVKRALLFGWKVYHTYDSRRSAVGFPDLVLVHEGKRKVAFVELKTEKGKLTKEQQEWIEALALTAANIVEIWRPSMMEHIIEVLR